MQFRKSDKLIAVLWLRLVFDFDAPWQRTVHSVELLVRKSFSSASIVVFAHAHSNCLPLVDTVRFFSVNFCLYLRVSVISNP